MMKIIACYSNKGGVGKTASAVNLAYACSCAGNHTLLCDMDPQGASGFYFRIKPSRKLKKQAFFKDVGIVIILCHCSPPNNSKCTHGDVV